ncbi:MAG TPA: nuclear transport factor 2 family protein [Acidobacteriota bacterium]|nr:nuclear transport factor 2 family protein [Acidobacteriota bacterium]
MHTYLKAPLALFLLTASIVAGGTNAPDAASDKAELLRLEKVWNDAHMQGDADSLDALWADELTVTVSGMPVLTRADAIAFARSGRMKFQQYETSDLQVRIYGDAAVVTGRLLRTRTINNRTATDDWRFTKVYIRRSDKWRVVAWHGSESAPQ